MVRNTSSFKWQDQPWLNAREQNDWLHQPLSIYECHLGSWQRTDNGEFLSYRELAHRLVDYIKETGFTHIELLPITDVQLFPLNDLPAPFPTEPDLLLVGRSYLEFYHPA